MMYVATDEPLPLLEYAKGSKLSIRLPTRANAKLRKVLTKPFIYEANAHNGCGCGFLTDDPSGLAEALESIQALADYLIPATLSSSVELFTCWAGNEGEPIDRKSEIDLKDLRNMRFNGDLTHYLLIRQRPFP